MPVAHPLHATPRPIRYLSLALAALLAACGHSPPQTALPPPGPGRPVSTEPAPGLAGCRQTPAARAALQGVALELQARGLALQVRCQEGNGGDGSSVVQLRVLDGIQARAVLRGPLADGQAVDMGTPCGMASAGAAVTAGGFSPDVQYNRQWLRALMARHQFDNLPDAWWHFAYRAGAPAPVR
ncbi:M15 family metallopeptidase [Verminephrobacter eiseniae]|uniref:M15 family metallopeptidase n=1 Tax=Verminephrobacter eiseniae TaxID=364317 RepID=UPI002236F253|nr:M15 family metallopeptidase [Verminephrobacter eiseniae]MCW5238295.1 D-Ala-D-Ala dipeptidase [Verminephrobacter eiseniae]